MNNYLQISVDTDAGWIPVATIPFASYDDAMIAELLSETGLLYGTNIRTENGGYRIRVSHLETNPA